MNIRHIQHLYWRACFGILPRQLEKIHSKSKIDVVQDIFLESKGNIPLLIETLEIDKINANSIYKNPKAQRAFLKKSREKIIEFNLAWMARLSNPETVLRERMTLFWANHFVCKGDNIKHVQDYNNTLRKHALGDLKVFVKAVSKEPAMLKYLNNKQNIKEKPNENFARELMELFTLGKGNYLEQDIKESARAFTGYFHDFDGNFILRKHKHDYGVKYFFRKEGNFNGDDIIDIIFNNKQCARFICEKIYRYFVNHNLNDTHVERMVSVFYPNYNIEQLMRYVFESDWFYEKENIGVKIKSPVDFLVGLNNVTPITFKDPKQLLALQKILGQVLLNPPNVAGWKGDKSWIDSNTILLRLRLPSVLLNGSYVSTKKKGEFNDGLAQLIEKNFKKNGFFKVEPNWSKFHKTFQNVPIERLNDYLISCDLTSKTELFIEDLNKASKQEFCIQLMSLPEYQMC